VSFYILVYYGSGIPLPPEQVDENRQAWRSWNAQLNETYGIRTARGVVIHREGVEPYRGDFKGASVIEAESLDAATEIAKRSPAIAYGGRVEVHEELERPES
jgi:hypothetical protein